MFRLLFLCQQNLKTKGTFPGPVAISVSSSSVLDDDYNPQKKRRIGGGRSNGCSGGLGVDFANAMLNKKLENTSMLLGVCLRCSSRQLAVAGRERSIEKRL